VCAELKTYDGKWAIMQRANMLSNYQKDQVFQIILSFGLVGTNQYIQSINSESFIES
jgi:hypothetical protein